MNTSVQLERVYVNGRIKGSHILSATNQYIILSEKPCGRKHLLSHCANKLRQTTIPCTVYIRRVQVEYKDIWETEALARWCGGYVVVESNSSEKAIYIDKAAVLFILSMLNPAQCSPFLWIILLSYLAVRPDLRGLLASCKSWEEALKSCLELTNCVRCCYYCLWVFLISWRESSHWLLL